MADIRFAWINKSTRLPGHKFKKIQHHAWHSKLVADIKLKLFYVGKGVSDLKACLDYCEDLAKVVKNFFFVFLPK